MRKILIVWVVLLWALQIAAKVQFPDYGGFVNDFAKTLGDASALKQRLAEYDRESGNQVVVVTIETSDPLTPQQYAEELFDAWRPGQKGKDNGVIILNAVNERRVVIRTGYGLEDNLPDARVGRILDDYGRTQPRGMVTVESGVITERKPDSVRGPDVAYWDVARDRPEDHPVGYLDQAPLLCVEVLSPGNKRKELEEKLREYFGRGVKMVWILSPEDRTAAVYRQPDQGQLFHQNASLTGEEVLPGFTCKVAALFA